MKQFINTKQAAQMLHVSSETLRRWDRQGLIEEGIYEITEGGHRRWDAQRVPELARLVGAGKTAPAAQARPHNEKALKELQTKAHVAQAEAAAQRRANQDSSRLAIVLIAAVSFLLTIMCLFTWMPARHRMLADTAQIHLDKGDPGWSLIAVAAMYAAYAACAAMIAAALVCLGMGVRAMVKEQSVSLHIGRYMCLMIAGAMGSLLINAMWTIVAPLRMSGYGDGSPINAAVDKAVGEWVSAPHWLGVALAWGPVALVGFMQFASIYISVGIVRVFARKAWQMGPILGARLRWRWEMAQGRASIDDKPPGYGSESSIRTGLLIYPYRDRDWVGNPIDRQKLHGSAKSGSGGKLGS